MALPIRIDENDLEYDDDQAISNGVPFTGIAFSDYPNSRLKREAPYKDGFEEGLCREWFLNGQLKCEWFAVHGRATGKVTEWHETGKIKSIQEVEYGAELSYDEWSDNGELLTHRQIDTASELFKYVQQMRRAESLKRSNQPTCQEE
jgi:antitoxin component YwqK of YwqJK toxin-antitoxin module